MACKRLHLVSFCFSVNWYLQLCVQQQVITNIGTCSEWEWWSCWTKFKRTSFSWREENRTVNQIHSLCSILLSCFLSDLVFVFDGKLVFFYWCFGRKLQKGTQQNEQCLANLPTWSETSRHVTVTPAQKFTTNQFQYDLLDFCSLPVIVVGACLLLFYWTCDVWYIA